MEGNACERERLNTPYGRYSRSNPSPLRVLFLSLCHVQRYPNVAMLLGGHIGVQRTIKCSAESRHVLDGADDSVEVQGVRVGQKAFKEEVCRRVRHAPDLK